MGTIVVVENVTLDGVMQSPGTEGDTRGGFTHGGWAAPYADAVPAETLRSGELVRSLAASGLVDRYTLLVHPLTLGQGATLFGDLEVRLDRRTPWSPARV